MPRKALAPLMCNGVIQPGIYVDARGDIWESYSIQGSAYEICNWCGAKITNGYRHGLSLSPLCRNCVEIVDTLFPLGTSTPQSGESK